MVLHPIHKFVLNGSPLYLFIENVNMNQESTGYSGQSGVKYCYKDKQKI